MDIVRSHIVLISGKRGSGKCLSGDTLISMSDGSQIPIKELENNKEKIFSLNPNLKIEQSPKIDFFSREVDRILEIKLRSGKKIRLTPEHPLLTIKGWIPVKELKIGSRIATPRKIPSFGENKMPEHEVKLLAYLIAEGHTKKIVLFSNSDDKIINEFKECLKNFDSALELIEEKQYHYRVSNPRYKTNVLETNNKRNEKGQFTKENKNITEKRSIRRLIEREGIFGKLSKEKELSNNILKLNEEQLSIFLNRLFSCDGSIYQSNGYWEISYCSSSEKLIQQIQHILLKFGILSKLRKKEIKLNNKLFHSFELVLNSENVIKFIESIGFFGKKKEKELIAKSELINKRSNPNVDTIPKEIWEMYRPKNWANIGRALSYKYPKAMRERIRYSPSKQTLLNIAQIEQYNPFYLLATSDIFWDEIVAMESFEGKFSVYDISVPNNHNFIANDIIVHNSYSIGVMAEELSDLPEESKQNIASLIFDTMGIFWTMKFKNEKEKELLREWKLKPKNLPVKIFAPYGKFHDYEKNQIPVDKSFALKASELEIEDWLLTFNLGIIDPVSVLIERVINQLKAKDYGIEDILKEITKIEEKEEIKKAASSLFEAAKTWGIFAEKEKGTEISELIEAGTTTILDLSCYSSVGVFNVRALVIGLVSRKLFRERMDARKKEEIFSVQRGFAAEEKKEMPLVWIFLDEAHEFIGEEKTPATDSLMQLLREGRQPGISLVLATQQPGAIHKDVMTQSDIIISHRVTAQPDILALNNIMQTYLLESIKKQLDDLPDLKGSAIILDDNSERIYPIRLRPRFTWHGGESPKAIREKQEI